MLVTYSGTGVIDTTECWWDFSTLQDSATITTDTPKIAHTESGAGI